MPGLSAPPTLRPADRREAIRSERPPLPAPGAGPAASATDTSAIPASRPAAGYGQATPHPESGHTTSPASPESRPAASATDTPAFGTAANYGQAPPCPENDHHTTSPASPASRPVASATDTPDLSASRPAAGYGQAPLCPESGQTTSPASLPAASATDTPDFPVSHTAVGTSASSRPATPYPKTRGTNGSGPAAPRHAATRRGFLGLAAAGSPALRAADPGFRFALIGDRTGTAAPQIYSRVWREASLFGPDLAVTIGDTIQGGNDATAAREWREMDTLWRQYRRFPTSYVPGNHDIWSPESKRLFEIEAGHPATHSFVHGGALFVILDNSLSDTLAAGQLEFCERTLARHRDLHPKFVFCHRPGWLLQVRVGSRNFDLHTLARKYEVDWVISGHGHQLVHLELDGIRYLEIGSSGGSIERGLKLGQGFKEGWFYHWIWVQVRGGKAEMTVKEAVAPGRVFRLSDWGPAGPRFDPGDPALLDSPRL